MWTIWQDAPAYGCDDHPSYNWYARRSVDGHIVQSAGPFNTKCEAEAFTATPKEA